MDIARLEMGAGEMTWFPLLIVGAWVAWLRFRCSERLRVGIDAGLRTLLLAHGTKTLVNGQRVGYVQPRNKPNRAQRRAMR